MLFTSRKTDRKPDHTGETLMKNPSPYSPNTYYVGTCKHEDCVSAVYRSEGAHYAYCVSQHRHSKVGGTWIAIGD